MANIGQVSPKEVQSATRVAMQLTGLVLQGSPVQQRASGGFINATAMCRAVQN